MYWGGRSRKAASILCTTIYLTPRLTSPSCAVDCGMLFLDNICVYILLAEAETRCCKHRSRAYQTCSVADIPSEAAAHARTIGHRTTSLHLFALKMPSNVPVFVVYSISLPQWATKSKMTSANHSPIRFHACLLPSTLYRENQDPSLKRTPLQIAGHH